MLGCVARRLVLFGIVAMCVPVAGTAQVPTPDWAIFNADQPRPGTRWRVVRTPHFDVMFHQGLEAAAQRTANSLERVHAALGKTMGGPPKRVTVVLQSQSILSNAYADLLPRREVWIAVPPSYPTLLGTNDWLTLLAIHETRHVAQYDRTNAGFTRLGGLLFGGLGHKGLAHLAVPGWMWEGDATAIETAFTDAGRGRMPDFDKEIRALALDGRLPGYYEAMLGSYDSFFPNAYPLGYHLTTHLRRRSGASAVGDLFAGASSHSYNPLAFHQATKRISGLTPPRLYDSTMRELTELWRAQIADLDTTPGRRLTDVPRAYTNYEDPHYLSDGSVIAVRSGLAERREIVRLSPAGVEVMADAWHLGDVRAGGMTLAWTDRVTDVRWGWSEENRIRLLDVDRGAVRTLTQGRYAFPIPSPDGKRVAAVELREDLTSAIVVLDAVTGSRVMEIPVPDGEHAMDPAWRADGGALVLTRQGLRGKALSLLDLSARTWRDLIPHGAEDVTRPLYAGEKVLFVSPWSGIDNVHAIDPATGRRWQVTSRRVGAYQPAASADASRLVFADYTSDGLAVMEAALDSSSWRPIDLAPRRQVAYYDTLVAQEQFKASAASDSDVTYPIRHPGLRSSIDVHSWNLAGNPFAGDIGASLISTNVLNTVSGDLTYIYHSRESASEVKASVSYAGLFPIVDLAGRYGARAASYDDGTDVTRVTWREQAIEMGLRVPLNFSRGQWSRSLSLGIHASLTHVSDLDVPARSPGNGTFAPVTTGLVLANVRASALRDVAPRWGQVVWAKHVDTPIGGDFNPSRSFAQGVLLFPGVAKHHSFQLRGAVERHRQDGGVRFSSEMPGARGYGFEFGPTMMKASADYLAPLAYPDLALGPVLYIPRLRIGAFGDYFRATSSAATRELGSAGAYLTADMIPFTWSFLGVSGGVAVIRRFRDAKWVVEPVIGLSF